MMLKCGEKNNTNYTFGKAETKIKKAHKAKGACIFCSACGKKLAKGADFCSKCGSPV